MFERLSPGTPHSIGRAHAWIFDDFRKLFERVLTILARSSPVNRSCPRLDIRRYSMSCTSTKKRASRSHVSKVSLTCRWQRDDAEEQPRCPFLNGISLLCINFMFDRTFP